MDSNIQASLRKVAFDPEDDYERIRNRALLRRTGREEVPNRTYDVLRLHLSSLEKKIDSYNKKATKAGSYPLVLRINETKWVPFKDSNIQVDNVTLIGDPPDVKSWCFLAHLDHKLPGNIVRFTKHADNKEEELTKQFRFRGPQCDHCQLRRARHDTYVIMNRDTNHIMQIGRNCLHEFLGADPDAALYVFDGIERLQKELNNGMDLDDSIKPDLAIPITYFAAAYSQLSPTFKEYYTNAHSVYMEAWEMLRQDRYNKQTRDNPEISDTFKEGIKDSNTRPAWKQGEAILANCALRFGKHLGDMTTNTEFHNFAVLCRDGMVSELCTMIAFTMIEHSIKAIKQDEREAQKNRPLEIRLKELMDQFGIKLDSRGDNHTFTTNELMDLIHNKGMLRALEQEFPKEGDTQAQEHKEPEVNGNFLGQVGDIITLQAKCTKIQNFGLRSVAEFHDKNQRLVSIFWESRDGAARACKLHEDHTISGKVKFHRYNRYARCDETVLNEKPTVTLIPQTPVIKLNFGS